MRHGNVSRKTSRAGHYAPPLSGLIAIWLVTCSCFGPTATESSHDAINANRRGGPKHIISCLSRRVITFDDAQKREIAIRRWEAALRGADAAKRLIPILYDIRAEKTALLVVDMQRAFLDPGASIEVPAGREIIPNINRLAMAVRDKGGTVIHFRYLVNEDVGMLKFFERQSYLGGDRVSPMKALRKGHPQFEIHPDIDVRESDLVMDKTRYSAVMGSDIVNVLREKGVENVIVTGVTTDVCAGNTAESLMQKDFHVVMVWDATAALDRLEHELYLARIFGLYGDVMPTEEVILRLK